MADSLTSVDLEEFAGIKKLEKPIPLKQFNVLVGRNNSGKSSLLRALGLLPQPNDTMLPLQYARFDLLAPMTHSYYRDVLIYGYEGRATVTYSVGQENAQLILESIFDPNNPEGSVGWYFRADKALAGPGVSVEPLLNSNLGIFRNAAPRPVNSQRAVYYSSELYQNYLQQITNITTWKKIEKSKAANRIFTEVINPTVGEKFTETTIYGYSGRAASLFVRKQFSDGTSSHIRVSELGTGIQGAIVPLLLIGSANPTIVLWDDFGTGMHPSLIESVLQWLARENWQVVISTHSIDVLGAAANLKSTNGQIIFMRKSSDDIVSHSEMPINELKTALESNQDPRFGADIIEFKEKTDAGAKVDTARRD